MSNRISVCLSNYYSDDILAAVVAAHKSGFCFLVKVFVSLWSNEPNALESKANFTENAQVPAHGGEKYLKDVKTYFIAIGLMMRGKLICGAVCAD